MVGTSLTLPNGNQVSPKDEIYSRNSAGQIGPRLGIVGELVPALDCYKVVIDKRDDERIISAIRSMIEENHLRALRCDYEAICDTFQSFIDHDDLESLVRAKHLCTEAGPRFGAAFEQALQEFHPYNYERCRTDRVKDALKPLIVAADAYLIVLSIGFHALTKLTPSTALNDRVVLPRVEKSIQLLETRLHSTLLPGGMVKKSPMASLLLNGEKEWFLEYYPYCIGYSGEAGILQMVVEANEVESEHWQEYRASRNTPEPSYYAFADTLIEILSRFKALLAIRLSFNPDANPPLDPRVIRPQLSDETPLLVEQMPHT
ncbi:TPA: hypothetical protein ACRNX7_003786 [Pseudomonas aeruginosa]|uniref:hypothetical protein n=1 Tax=Pseudomonas aeruginosa TaxID=287 RepID=UPI00129869D9|nr:hypothetical protein [Pseudomonas aeruginosa]